MYKATTCTMIKGQPDFINIISDETVEILTNKETKLLLNFGINIENLKLNNGEIEIYGDIKLFDIAKNQYTDINGNVVDTNKSNPITGQTVDEIYGTGFEDEDDDEDMQDFENYETADDEEDDDEVYVETYTDEDDEDFDYDEDLEEEEELVDPFADEDDFDEDNDDDEDDFDEEDEETEIAKLFKSLTEEQRDILRKYTMWYSRHLFANISLESNADISDLKVKDLSQMIRTGVDEHGKKINGRTLNKMKQIQSYRTRKDANWVYAGYIDFGLVPALEPDVDEEDKYMYRCSFGHNVRYLHIIWDSAAANLDTFAGNYYQNYKDTSFTSFTERDNVIKTGTNCLSDFFDIPKDSVIISILQRMTRNNNKDLEILYNIYKRGNDYVTKVKQSLQLLEDLARVSLKGKGVYLSYKNLAGGDIDAKKKDYYEKQYEDIPIKMFIRMRELDLIPPYTLVLIVRSILAGWHDINAKVNESKIFNLGYTQKDLDKENLLVKTLIPMLDYYNQEHPMNTVDENFIREYTDKEEAKLRGLMKTKNFAYQYEPTFEPALRRLVRFLNYSLVQNSIGFYKRNNLPKYGEILEIEELLASNKDDDKEQGEKRKKEFKIKWGCYSDQAYENIKKIAKTEDKLFDFTIEGGTGERTTCIYNYYGSKVEYNDKTLKEAVMETVRIIDKFVNFIYEIPRYLHKYSIDYDLDTYKEHEIRKYKVTDNIGWTKEKDMTNPYWLTEYIREVKEFIYSLKGTDEDKYTKYGLMFNHLYFLMNGSTQTVDRYRGRTFTYRNRDVFLDGALKYDNIDTDENKIFYEKIEELLDDIDESLPDFAADYKAYWVNKVGEQNNKEEKRIDEAIEREEAQVEEDRVKAQAQAEAQAEKQKILDKKLEFMRKGTSYFSNLADKTVDNSNARKDLVVQYLDTVDMSTITDPKYDLPKKIWATFNRNRKPSSRPTDAQHYHLDEKFYKELTGQATSNAPTSTTLTGLADKDVEKAVDYILKLESDIKAKKTTKKMPLDDKTVSICKSVKKNDSISKRQSKYIVEAYAEYMLDQWLKQQSTEQTEG